MFKIKLKPDAKDTIISYTKIFLYTVGIVFVSICLAFSIIHTIKPVYGYFMLFAHIGYAIEAGLVVKLIAETLKGLFTIERVEK